MLTVLNIIWLDNEMADEIHHVTYYTLWRNLSWLPGLPIMIPRRMRRRHDMETLSAF